MLVSLPIACSSTPPIHHHQTVIRVRILNSTLISSQFPSHTTMTSSTSRGRNRTQQEDIAEWHSLIKRNPESVVGMLRNTHEKYQAGLRAPLWRNTFMCALVMVACSEPPNCPPLRELCSSGLVQCLTDIALDANIYVLPETEEAGVNLNENFTFLWLTYNIFGSIHV
ncbi:hypothetical protein C8Q75DRAFT_773523 [Abortiporus biennis]|nr:hypothetical protein C8Q75DRAFT_773523 [Abortiporus biennis]